MRAVVDWRLRQLLAINDNWHGTDLQSDISDTAMLRSAVDCKRCVLTEPKRCDELLFAWLPSIAGEGWRWQLPLPDVLEHARAAFPKRGRAQQNAKCAVADALIGAATLLVMATDAVLLITNCLM